MPSTRSPRRTSARSPLDGRARRVDVVTDEGSCVRRFPHWRSSLCISGSLSSRCRYGNGMRAMVLDSPGLPLSFLDVEPPRPGPGEVRLRVRVCGVCRTDLHVVDGDLREPKAPLILGHQIVGEVETLGAGVDGLALADRVGVPWLGWTCGECSFCASGRENLCPRARFTGYQIDGGYAELAVADARYCLPIPDGYPDLQAAPLLCAGLIGWRCLKMAGDPERLGIFGFGAAAHIVTQVARWQGRRVFAFTRPGDRRGPTVARSVRCERAGGSDQVSPVELDAAILFAPAGGGVP